MPFAERSLLGIEHLECTRCGKAFYGGKTAEECQAYCDVTCPDRGIPGTRVVTVDTGIVAPSGSPVVRQEEVVEAPEDAMPDLGAPGMAGDAPEL